MRKKIDVLIVYEHRNREIESAIMIKGILMRRGYSVEIVQVGFNEAIAKFIYSPKVIVVPWCYDNNDVDNWLNYKGQLDHAKMNILNLHCEQLTYDDAIDFIMPHDNAQLTYHSSWGPYFSECLMKRGVHKNLILETGSTRLDFFKPQYVSSSKKELAERYNIDFNKKWVLVVGNFSGMTIDNRDYKDLKSRGIKNIEQLSDLSRDSFYEIIRWSDQVNTGEVSEKVVFIYRPHPNEKRNSIIDEQVSKHNNFHYIGELAIREWYQACDLALLWTSTSAVEAVASGIPVYALQPYEIPENKKIHMLDSLQSIDGYEQFEKTIHEFVKKEKLSTNEEFISSLSYYYGDFSVASCEKTVSYIEEIMNDNSTAFETKQHVSLKVYKELLAYSVKWLLNKLHLLSKFKKWEVVSKDIISQADMEKLEKQAYLRPEKDS